MSTHSRTLAVLLLSAYCALAEGPVIRQLLGKTKDTVTTNDRMYFETHDKNITIDAGSATKFIEPDLLGKYTLISKGTFMSIDYGQCSKCDTDLKNVTDDLKCYQCNADWIGAIIAKDDVGDWVLTDMYGTRHFYNFTRSKLPPRKGWRAFGSKESYDGDSAETRPSKSKAKENKFAASELRLKGDIYRNTANEASGLRDCENCSGSGTTWGLLTCSECDGTGVISTS